MKLELIPDKKNYAKFWSVRLSALAAILMTVIEFAPKTLATTWALLPEAMQAALPDDFLRYTAIILIVGSMVARAVKQRKLDA